MRIRVEELLLHGPAVTGAPPGLVATGNAAPTLTGIDNLPDAVGRAKAELAVNDVQANFAAAHPFLIEEEESTTGTDGQYVQTVDDAGRIRRLPLVPSVALQAHQVLVGDGRIAGYLGVRSPVSASVGQESYDFVRNRVTILAEGRWAPVVLVPRALAVMTVP